jgi:hypothetical protein
MKTSYLDYGISLVHTLHMSTQSDRRPKDPNQLAKYIVDMSTGQIPKEEPPPEKNPAAVALGRLGTSKGGKARAEKLSAKKRSQIAKKAAHSRWAKKAAQG